MKKYLVLCAVVVFALSIPILAAADTVNVRPVSPLGPSFSGEQSLQSIFTDNDPGLNAISGQLPYAIWRPNEKIVETTFKLEITGFYPGDKFGIYSFADPTDMLTIMDGSGGLVGKAFTITFDANGVLGRVRSVNATDNTVVQTLNNFDGYNFGFWLSTLDQGGEYFYSEDSRNPGGLAQMLAFRSIEDQGDWWLCWEDLQRSISLNPDGSRHSDSDFQDIVIKAESMTPVPEPSTMLLLGLGLVGLAGIRRKFKS